MHEGLKVKGLKEARTQMARLSNYLRRGDKSIWKRIGEAGTEAIRKRTAQSKDADDKKFKPYSKRYWKYGQPVDLSVTGTMLANVLHQPGNKFVRIYLSKRKHRGIKLNHFQLAEIHNFGGRSGWGGGFNMPKREFMGLTKRQVKELRDVFGKIITDKISNNFKKV